MGKKPSRILGRICALGVELSVVLGATELPPPELSEPYTVTPCGQVGQIACSITPTGRTPTAADLQGLTNNLFVSFLVAHGYGPDLPSNPTFSWTPRAANANGYVIGNVVSPGGFGGFMSQFIYHAGQVLCCLSDPSNRLWDINDQNVVTGTFGFSAGTWLLFASNSDVNQLFLTFTDPTFDPNDHAAAPTYSAIDNQDRILLGRPGLDSQLYMLQPTPEPASIVFLVTVLIGCGILTRWRPKYRGVLK
jgi:hypothetical protein